MVKWEKGNNKGAGNILKQESCRAAEVEDLLWTRQKILGVTELFAVVGRKEYVFAILTFRSAFTGLVLC